MSGHPPLFFIALASSWKIFGRSLLTSHVFTLIFGAQGLTFLFKLTKKIFGCKEAATASLLLLSNQLFFAQVGITYISIPLTCLAILTVYTYLNNRNWLFVASATAMLLVKETSIIILLAIIMYDFINSMLDKKKLFLALKRTLFLSLPVIPLVLWYLYHWRMSGWLVNTKLIVNKTRFLGLFLDNSIRYLFFDSSFENVNKVNWIIFLAISMFIFIQIAKRKSLRSEMLFLTIIFLNIGFFSYTDDLPRYFLVMYPFFFVLGARAFVFLSEKSQHKKILLPLMVTAVIFLSVMNYSGHRSTDGWRLESNMEYLDFVKVSQLACQFLEDNYPGHKIIAIFPMDYALRTPWFGYVKKPLCIIPLDEFGLHEDLLIVRTYQSNDLFSRKYFHINPNDLEQIEEFSVKGKKVIIYRKKKHTLTL